VLDWAETARRDLPWRRTRDPWALLVSEVMLAQTQVGRVIRKWETFMERWPDPGACARAPRAEVIAAWAGLGYNRRAVWLHQAAAIISERHAGRVPASLIALTALPGVGPYTARAVLVFAFEQPVGVVDTNVARVLARAVTGHHLSGAEAQRQADRLVPARRAWAWNQALLDLGATVCTARRPACDACPVGTGESTSRLCRWARSGGPDPAARRARPPSPFAGSDRQGRGRLLAVLVAPTHGRDPHQIRPEALAAAAGWPGDPSRAMRAALSLVADGLAVMGPDGILGLPGQSVIRHTASSGLEPSS
jgi:A/G-specific adenine glycosylase